MNESVYHQQSAELLRSQLPSHIAWMCICTLTFVMASFLLVLMCSWKKLRTMNQALIFGLFANDVLQSVLWGVFGGHHLYLSVNHLPEMFDQRTCMYWLLPLHLTDFSSNFIILCISIDRLLAISWPNFYRRKHARIKLIALGLTPPLAAAFAVVGLIGVDDRPNLVCSATQSYTEFYSHFVSVYENGVVALVALISVITCGLILHRYRRHVRSRSNNLNSFKRDIQSHVLKLLGSLVLMYLLSQGVSSAFISILRNSQLTDAQKGAYGPATGCLHLARGLLDCCIYIGFCTEYRKAARFVFGLVFCRTPDNSNVESIVKRLDSAFPIIVT